MATRLPARSSVFSVSIMPVVVDFGLLQMEDANWTTDETLVGKCVCIQIDRLEIVPAIAPDFPKEAGGGN